MLMKSKPYQSPLEQHYEFIRDERRARKTWPEIASKLKADKGVTISDKGLIMWFKRRQQRKSLPLGFENDIQAPGNTTQPPANKKSGSAQVAKLLGKPNPILPTPSRSPWNFGADENSTLTKKNQ
jgi:hypothetical protein